MKKYQNPFWALDGATELLQARGANPFEDEWADHVLSLTTSFRYDSEFNCYHTVTLHLDLPGFRMLMERLGESQVEKVPHDERYVRYVCYLCEDLEIMALGHRVESVCE